MDINKMRKNLKTMIERKKKELDRRSQQEKFISNLADKAFKVNKEQWEAYITCIKHQQDKMIILIHDIITIENLLSGLTKINERGKNHDRYV